MPGEHSGSPACYQPGANAENLTAYKRRITNATQRISKPAGIRAPCRETQRGPGTAGISDPMAYRNEILGPAGPCRALYTGQCIRLSAVGDARGAWQLWLAPAGVGCELTYCGPTQAQRARNNPARNPERPGVSLQPANQ